MFGGDFAGRRAPPFERDGVSLPSGGYSFCGSCPDARCSACPFELLARSTANARHEETETETTERAPRWRWLRRRKQTA